jgi:protein phosphatase
MGTTLVAAAFAHGKAILGNVGDSRCYRLRNRELQSLTQEHSFGAEFRRREPNATEQAKLAAEQFTHVLTRCLSGDEVSVDTRVVRCEPGDVFLLCSDGLWGGVSHQTMAGILANAQYAQDTCERLIAAAWMAGGLDNIGVAVVRLEPMALRLNEPSRLDEPSRTRPQPAEDA